MKRARVDIKKTIKKRIEHRHNNKKYIQKSGIMNEKTMRRAYGSVKPINVGLVGRQGIATSETIFYNINTNEYQIDLYKKIFETEPEKIEPIKVLFLISNYEREKMLKDLLEEIKSYNSEQIIVDYIIFDDVSSYTLDDPNFIVNPEHRGKFKYWQTFDDMFKYCQNNYYDIYIFSPNDFIDYNFNKMVEYGVKLSKHQYIFNTLEDGRITCWNRTKPINLTDEVNQYFFTDCGFFTNQLTLKALEFKINPITTANPIISSQVGKQITNRINQLKIPIFHPIQSLVYHGYHQSLMNPNGRENNSTNMETIDINTIKTFVINLDKRKDRLQELNIPFNWERFAAIEASPGYVGCLQSHRTVLEKALELKLESVLIFEDDVELCEDFEVKFNDVINKLPEDWDLLYLGGWNKGVMKHYADGLDVAENVVCMHAYMVRGKFLPIAIQALHSKDGIEKVPNDYKCDVLLAESLLKGKCYICNPTLAWQRVGYSDIEGLTTNNLHLKDPSLKAVVISPPNGTTFNIKI